MLKDLMVFEYKRGDTFSVKIAVNGYAGSVTFHDIIVPINTPAEVKKLFLEEAEKAAHGELLKLEEQMTGGYGGYYGD